MAFVIVCELSKQEVNMALNMPQHAWAWCLTKILHAYKQANTLAFAESKQRRIHSTLNSNSIATCNMHACMV